MGKRVHCLSDLDPVARTAVCANCGPTRIWPRNGTSWQCARGAQPKPVDTHGLTSVNQEEKRACCSVCGPTKIRVYYRDNRQGEPRPVFQCWAVWQQRQARYARKARCGLTPEAFEALLEAQGGCCATCRDPLDVPHVDHDHSCCPGTTSCGKCVRGLLCGSCNTALGLFQDDPVRLLRAVDYLLRLSESEIQPCPSK